MIKGPIWCFLYADINWYEYFMFLICLNDLQWSTAHEFPSHGYKCCKVLCFFFHRKPSVLFSPKLLNSECVLPSSIAVTLSTVLVLPCSRTWLNTKYCVVYLLFSVRTMRYKLVVLWYFCHFCSCALMVFFSFLSKSRNHFLLKEGNNIRVCAL